MLVFEERGKLVYPEKTFQNKGENQKQTRSSVMYASTFGTQTWGMLVGGKCSHHYATLVSMACGQRCGQICRPWCSLPGKKLKEGYEVTLQILLLLLLLLLLDFNPQLELV